MPNYNHILNQLETELEITNNKIKNLTNLKQHADSLRARITAVRERIKVSKSGRTEVTDHAIVRYLERREGLDVEKIRKKILSRSAKKLINDFGGNGTYSVNGMKITLKDNKVITVF